MPGPVSDSYPGPSDRAPYVPSWCYDDGPRMCPCGHHEGYHNDAGACLLAAECGCVGIPPEYVTPMEDLPMTEIEHDIRGDEPAEKAPRPEFAWYSQAALDVVAERRRQIECEGWTPEHDDSHDSCELAAAAACYAVCADSRQVGKLNYDGARLWPGRWLFKPKTYRENIVRAAALLIAEIERLDRRDPPNLAVRPTSSPTNQTETATWASHK